MPHLALYDGILYNLLKEKWRHACCYRLDIKGVRATWKEEVRPSTACKKMLIYQEINIKYRKTKEGLIQKETKRKILCLL